MNKMMTLKEIEKRVNLLAKKINAAKENLPTYGVSRDFGYPHVEVSKENYSYIVVERGHETRHENTCDIDELLYIIFYDTTLVMAIQFESENRVEHQDPRRLIFSRQEDLLGILSQEWRERCHDKNLELIKKEPFDDYSFERALLCKSLREKGYLDEEAWKEACRNYPLPKT